jgi:hypothetical protein
MEKTVMDDGPLPSFEDHEDYAGFEKAQTKAPGHYQFRERVGAVLTSFVWIDLTHSVFREVRAKIRKRNTDPYCKITIAGGRSPLSAQASIVAPVKSRMERRP